VISDGESLDADILSTALFVAGTEEAIEYARKHGFGLYLVDDEGRAHVVPGPDDAPFSIEEVSEPLPE
jgi:thiamine biosynthesis lipoprotein ApbE